MKSGLLLLFPILLFAISPVNAANKKDTTTPVNGKEADEKAAIAKARELLPKFWDVFEHRKNGEESFCLKVKITDAHGTEYFWMDEIELKKGRILGTINNEPKIVKSVKYGQHMEIPPAQIVDWLYVRDGKTAGNYTMRALFKQMPPEEAGKYKTKMIDP